jgi:hypothetical protein
MALITADEFPAVRAAINVELDEVGLPDNIIALPIYLGAADNEVKRRDPLWTTRTTAELRRLKNAVIYLTAARIVIALPRPNAEAFGQRYSYKIDQLSAAQLSSSLEAFADSEINAVLTPGSDETLEQPITFSLGQVCRPNYQYRRWGRW